MALNPFTRSVSEVASWSRGEKRGPVWIYAHPSMENLAKDIAERCTDQKDNDLHGRKYLRDRRTVVFKNTIQWGCFHDGFPNLFIQDVKDMAGKDVIFLASFHDPAIIFEQLSVIYAIPRYLAHSFTIILPYFPTGTMERVDTEGQIATAKTLATLLSSTPLTARGPSQIVVFDIHALQERFYFSESVIPRLETAIPLLLHELSALPEDESVSIAFPDEGASKRFHMMFEGKPTIVCFKRREGAKRVVKVKDGDPSGSHVVIVDDLVQTGGTLIECAKALYAQGASKVSAYVTHGVFPKESWKRFTESEVKFANFWITDSVPHAVKIAENPPFKLLSLSHVVADMLYGYDLLNW